MRSINVTWVLFAALLGCGGGREQGAAAGGSGGGGADTQAGGGGGTAAASSAAGRYDGGAVTGAADGGSCVDDTDCAGLNGNPDVDVYVNPYSGQDTSDGSPISPKNHILPAIQTAQARKGRVFLAAGTYPITAPLNVTGSWKVYGGYTTDFKGRPDRARTILQVDAGGLILSGAPTATLAHVTVTASSASDPKQPSSHGLRSSVTALTLDDVDVVAGDGLAGVAGTSGFTGAQGIVGGSTWQYDGVFHTAGAIGLKCNGVAQPLYTNGGYSGETSPAGLPPGNLATKTLPQTGPAGSDGSPGANAPATPTLVNNLVAWAKASDGFDDGTPGVGGPGGGSSSDLHVEGGGGGSGGCPGTHGTGGTSGGGSVAVLVLQGTLTLTRSHLQTGLGGDGGDGSPGGPGGSGGLGGVPGGMLSATYPATCTPATDPFKVNCADYGAQGGPGGAGGYGGAGAGGWAVGVLAAPGASANVDALTQYALGSPGFGGRTGTGIGPAGAKKQTYSIAP